MKGANSFLSRGLANYSYGNLDPGHDAAYLDPVIVRVAAQESAQKPGFRIFDLGAGNGARLLMLSRLGYDVVGVEPSESGVAIAKTAHPDLKLFSGSSEDDLPGTHGRFPLVISLEVIEHVFNPRQFAASLYSLVQPGGLALVSTPYHGYWKNLALALAGKMDDHYSPLWDGGHIKFWSIATLSELLREAGFAPVTFERVGRIPALAKSMIALARRPLES